VNSREREEGGKKIQRKKEDPTPATKCCFLYSPPPGNYENGGGKTPTQSVRDLFRISRPLPSIKEKRGGRKKKRKANATPFSHLRACNNKQERGEKKRKRKKTKKKKKGEESPFLQLLHRKDPTTLAFSFEIPGPHMIRKFG